MEPEQQCRFSVRWGIVSREWHYPRDRDTVRQTEAVQRRFLRAAIL
nr:hypothetical protein [Petrachloros mirabilis]